MDMWAPRVLRPTVSVFKNNEEFKLRCKIEEKFILDIDGSNAITAVSYGDQKQATTSLDPLRYVVTARMQFLRELTTGMID